MTRREQIKNAYKLSGDNSSFYDGMMTYSTVPGKAICRIIWNMDGEKNLRYLEKALSGIPMDFSGKLLEVPVGTGVLTIPVYRDLPNADITCLDYSENMMASAKEKANQQESGISHFCREMSVHCPSKIKLSISYCPSMVFTPSLIKKLPTGKLIECLR